MCTAADDSHIKHDVRPSPHSPSLSLIFTPSPSRSYSPHFPVSPAGVKSFKIEGRLKGPEYVAITTRAYRLAVDEAWRNLHLDSETDTTEGVKNRGLHELTMKMPGASLSSPTAVTTTSSPRFNGLDEELMRDLRQVFSRGQDEEYDGLSAGEI